MKGLTAIASAVAIAACLILAGAPVAAQSVSASAAESPNSTRESLSEEEQSLLAERKMVESMREKRIFRMKWWAARLKGDMKATYMEHGHPSYRYREYVMGSVVEKWTYLRKGKQFTFKDSRLIDARSFRPGTLGAFGRLTLQP
jgi:hypothetical protein